MHEGHPGRWRASSPSPAPLPNATAFVPDSSWVDGHGVPYQLTFGWAASTGNSTDYHTISNVNVQTLNGTPPTLGVTLTDNSGGTAHSGQTVNYTAITTLSGSDETRPITLTDTFPADLVPQTDRAGRHGLGLWRERADRDLHAPQPPGPRPGTLPTGHDAGAGVCPGRSVSHARRHRDRGRS